MNLITAGDGARVPAMRSADRRRVVTARRYWVWLAVVAVTASSCALAPVPGAPPLRYRDAIFSSVTKTSDIVYGTANDRQGNPVTLKLDLYQPTGDRVTKRPLIIWVHGGSFRAGNKTSPEIVDESNTFAKEGYVNASIDYRLSTSGCPPVNQECINAIYDANADAQTAVRFLRSSAAKYHIDPTRIAIGGTSAGAITALHVGYRLASPGAVPPSAASNVLGAVSLSGASYLASEDKGDAPALLFHGTADPLVPYAQARSTVEGANAAGLEAYLVTWNGDGHVPYTKHRDQILDLTRNFLYRKLDAGGAAR
jgi:acetyl esterase/lipase